MEPVMIDQYANIDVLVSMCIGTDKGSWWADAEFGSNLWKLKQTGKTVESLADDVRREIEACLSWLVSDGLASSISCQTSVTGKTAISWVVTVVRPSGTEQLIKDVWNAV